MALRRYLRQLQASARSVTVFYGNNMLSPASYKGTILNVYTIWLRVEAIELRDTDGKTQLIPWHSSNRIEISPAKYA